MKLHGLRVRRAAMLRRRLRDTVEISKISGIGSVEHLHGAALRHGARFAWITVRGRHVEILVERMNDAKLASFRGWVNVYRRHDQVVDVRRGSP